jgi:preprotein translocase subunit Sss1
MEILSSALGKLVVGFIGTIIFLVLVVALWIGLTLLSYKFWSWFIPSGHAPRWMRRTCDRFCDRKEHSGGDYKRFFHIGCGFLGLGLIGFVLYLVCALLS